MPASARPEPTDLQTGGRRDLTPLTVAADRVPPGRPPQSARHCSPPAAGAAALQAAPPGCPAVLARPYQPELAASRGVIATRHHQGQLLMLDLAEKPAPDAARALEQRYGTSNLLLLEGRARLTAGFIRFAPGYQTPALAASRSPAVTARWLRQAGPWLSWPACADGDQSDWPGIALGPNWGSGRCFGQDVDRCRLLFLLGYAGARVRRRARHRSARPRAGRRRR